MGGAEPEAEEPQSFFLKAEHVPGVSGEVPLFLPDVLRASMW